MKKIDENNVNLRKNMAKTPFEKTVENAKKRAILAQIFEDTHKILASYEHIAEVSKVTGMALETLEKMADDAIIELAQAMETHFGVSA